MEKWPHHRKGAKFTPEQLKRLSDAHKGYKPNEKQLQTLLFHATGVMNNNWKGDGVSYRNLHRWVRRHLGHPASCSKCGAAEVIVKRTNIQWANISRQYKREKTDWMPLCVSCHKKYDLNRRELTTA